MEAILGSVTFPKRPGKDERHSVRHGLNHFSSAYRSHIPHAVNQPLLFSAWTTVKSRIPYLLSAKRAVLVLGVNHRGRAAGGKTTAFCTLKSIVLPCVFEDPRTIELPRFEARLVIHL